MLVTCGEALIDFVPLETPAGAYQPVPGGAPFNVAIAAARLGAETGFLGAIADDWLGEMLRQRLRDNGVSERWIARRETATPLALVGRSATGSTEYLFHGFQPETSCLAAEHLPPVLPSTVRCLQIGGLAATLDASAVVVERLLERERGQRVIVLDPNVRPPVIVDRMAYLQRFHRQVACADIIKLSDEDARWMAPDLDPVALARELLDQGPRLVVLTCGGESALALTARTSLRLAPPRISVRDTVGAGDTFTAAVIVWLDRCGLLQRDALGELSDPQLAELLGFANMAAAICCTRAGADAPSLDDVEAALADSPGFQARSSDQAGQ